MPGALVLARSRGRCSTSCPEGAPETPKAWWQPPEESSEVGRAPRGPEDAAETASPLGAAGKPWWQDSEDDSGVAGPRSHDGDQGDGAAGHSWSRIRTPSPEYRYAALHDTSDSGTPKSFTLPLPALQRRTPCPEAPMVVPPPWQRLLLVDLLRRGRAEGDHAHGDRACQRQHRGDERLGLGGPAGGGPRLAPVDAHAHSIGSVGHPHSCALPCKFSRGGRVCKDGTACRRCHLCAWTRSEQRNVAVEEHARAQR